MRRGRPPKLTRPLSRLEIGKLLRKWVPAPGAAERPDHSPLSSLVRKHGCVPDVPNGSSEARPRAR
jgi:hypothetical protein